jgi:hypothetical protein
MWWSGLLGSTTRNEGPFVIGAGAGVEVDVDVDAGVDLGAGVVYMGAPADPQQHALPHCTSTMGVRNVSWHRSPTIRRAKRVPTCAPSPDRRRVSVVSSPTASLAASQSCLWGVR